eukprot:c9998_g1_i1.p1 GENE.c9998_g1_i1~~c9998_g1_i1.p1  ORF type:complete len:384 (-),score=105.62 c9998_g1_i1:216-1367(-)
MEKVVIVGGGPAGYTVAAALDNQNLDVTLIEKLCVYHNSVSALRATVDETYRWQQFQPYSGLLKGKSSRVVHGEVVGVEGGVVKLKDGTTFPYDYLVIATGSQNPFPAKLEALDSVKEGIAKYSDVEEEISKAQQILIVGGGPVGVELAGEIKTYFPHKEVTILHRGATVLNNQGGAPPLSPQFIDGVTKLIRDLYIKLILEDSLEHIGNEFEAGPKTLVTKKGIQIETDLVFYCTGSKPNTHMFKSSFGSSMDQNGYFNVNSHFQIEGHTNVFAIGDVTSIREPKLAYTASAMHGPITAKNILALSKNKPVTAAHKPFQNTSMMVVGPHKGIAQVGFLPWPLGGVHTWGMFASIKNNERLFVGKSWKIVTGSPLPTTNPHQN